MGYNGLERLLTGGARRAWRDSVFRARQDVFGSARGKPGEEEWLKPLRGRSRTRWYWPSKYLHMDFSMRHYLAMQLKRMEKKREDPSIIKLWDTVKLFNTHSDVIKSFMGNVDENRLKRSTTLQDVRRLLQIISRKAPQTQVDETKNNDNIEWERFEPYINYSFAKMNEDASTVMAPDLVRGRTKFRQMLEADPSITRSLGVRNRFVDALYLRRRAYYLEKLSRKKPVSETIQKYRKHFLTHPDEKVIWPEHKGISQHSWPSR